MPEDNQADLPEENNQPASNTNTIPNPSSLPTKNQPIIGLFLGSGAFALLVGAIYEYWSVVGFVNQNAGILVLVFAWAVGVVGILVSEFTWAKAVNHKVAIGAFAALGLGLLLFLLHIYTIHHLPSSPATITRKDIPWLGKELSKYIPLEEGDAGSKQSQLTGKPVPQPRTDAPDDELAKRTSSPTVKSSKIGKSVMAAASNPSRPADSAMPSLKAKYRLDYEPDKLTLHDLFLTDFMPAQQREYGGLNIPLNSGSHFEIEYEIVINLEARSKFLVFYLPAADYTYDACSYLSRQCEFVLTNAPQQLLVNEKVPGDSQTISTQEAVFSKRVFVYHETYLEPEQTVRLANIYANSGLAVIFRSVDYISNKRLEAKLKLLQAK